jgi:hypothetical protein
MGVCSDLCGFVLAHRGCGELRGDAEPLTPAGYRLWVAYSCGARFERWSPRTMRRRICCARRCWRSRADQRKQCLPIRRTLPSGPRKYVGGDRS